MSNFVVSARKYRPVRFEEVVGQEHVSMTLKNALQNDHLAHAFLFCGPRGVGKTTCARILAKVLNCQNLSDDHEPCNTCGSCESFNENASFNIMELDAASNNSVDHIRTLVEQVRFQPQQGKFKVFIIDEVHMLSQAAFNAFLKTLEEPPPYAIFILATTEKHKIIPTILSRCQIFDFKRIQVPQMVAHLEGICQKEGIEADKDALHIIAQKADGALRDSLSIFDRIVSFSGKKITYQDVITNLNVLDYDYFFKFTDAMLAQDMAKVMLIFDEITRNGFEGDIFMNGLGEHFRNLLVCKDPQTLKLLEVGDNLKGNYSTQAQIAPASFLLSCLNIANDCDINYKMARNKRLHVEMALVKMTFVQQAIQLSNQPQNYLEKKNLDGNESLGKIEEPPAPSLEKESLKEAPIPLEKPVEPETVVVTEEASATSQQQATVGSQQSAVSSQQLAVSSQEVNPNPQPAANKLRNHSKLGMPKLSSLDDMDAEIEATEAKEKPTEVANLSQEQLEISWQKYLETVEQITTKNILRSSTIKLNGEQVQVIVGSSLAVNTLRQETELMAFLRKELGFQKLSLNIQIDPEKALSNNLPERPKPVTDSEKYWRMKSQNPVVDEMRKRFDLKFDND